MTGAISDFAWRNVQRAVDGIGRRTVRRGFDDLMSLGCSIIHKFSDSDSVCLTFDDSPNPNSTLKILDSLERHRICATFYCIGENVVRYPQLVDAIAKSGHELGNHSMTHPDFYRLMPRRLRWEVESCQAAIQAVCSRSVPSFRAPYGHFRWDLRYLDGVGIERLVKWDIAPPWHETNSGVLAKDILSSVEPGSIILLHDGLAGVDQSLSRAAGIAAAECVDRIAPVLLARGLKFKTVTQQAAEFRPVTSRPFLSTGANAR